MYFESHEGYDEIIQKVKIKLTHWIFCTNSIV